MNLDVDRIARLALLIAGVPASRHLEVTAEVASRLDKDLARRRRDLALREAADILRAAGGGVRMLSTALRRYRASAWPGVRNLPSPPQSTPPLAACYWRACRAAEDAGIDLPDYRQLRRIVE